MGFDFSLRVCQMDIRLIAPYSSLIFERNPIWFAFFKLFDKFRKGNYSILATDG
jgi:hypothetical protein